MSEMDDVVKEFLVESYENLDRLDRDLVELEKAPDTVITLATGEKIVVLETAAQVLDLIVQFRQRILAGPSLPVGVPNPPVV